MGKGSWLEKLGLKRAPVSLGEFREIVVAEVRRRKPEVELQLVGEASIARGEDRIMTVEHDYAYYLGRVSERDAVVGQLAELLLFEAPLARADELIVLVRPAEFQAQGKEREDKGLARPIAAGLIAVVACDTSDRYVFSTASKLRADLGLEDEAIWDRAHANLRERIDIVPPRLEFGKVVTIQTGARLASSLLAVRSFWEDPDLLAAGDLVVLPLESDQLIFTRAGEAELIQWMRRLAVGWSSPEFLSDRLLLRRGGRWEEFE
ncbi:MAG: hypothetical protein ABW360_02555 [Phenylobacterium sp.]